MEVMLDIETLGTKPGCAVLTVGAVAFDFETGQEGGNFYRVISLKDSQTCGLTIDAETLGWWLGQDQDAQKGALLAQGKVPLADAAADFSKWFQAHCTGNVWAQGMDFDMPIWGRAMECGGVSIPWKFWACRDTRTAYQVCGFDTSEVTRSGVYHNALDDARHQVKCLMAAMRSK